MEEKRSAFKAYLGKSDTPTKYITDISKSEALTFCKTLYTNNQKEHDVRCTWDGDSLTTYKAEIQKETCSSGSSYPCAKPTPDTTATDYNIYYKQLKLQLGDKLSTFSLEKLETVLTKTEKTIKKLREGSKNKLRLQALVILIKEEISNQEENINIDDLLN